MIEFIRTVLLYLPTLYPDSITSFHYSEFILLPGQPFPPTRSEDPNLITTKNSNKSLLHLTYFRSKTKNNHFDPYPNPEPVKDKETPLTNSVSVRDSTWVRENTSLNNNRTVGKKMKRKVRETEKSRKTRKKLGKKKVCYNIKKNKICIGKKLIIYHLVGKRVTEEFLETFLVKKIRSKNSIGTINNYLMEKRDRVREKG
ncbi:hypothetical protein CWI38_0932p0020 [Hamiltosporidium tvaerminnensis]|uniref:Uncharacterized protein n=1 Tax=Hamiltosporidium tvaerminnensis TaxID=1176355 RepID=A0A4Q9LWE6_9MICR|nr:hypothetical protein CWI38_0932p0020 [Hamiltosporidium tvaerminnensis]